tara:strand:+ start:243 stop:443 length:201 start_codon:yes stop_codon:yes gene_type:complete
MKLNDRQIKFVELVFQGHPAGRAYEKAGYKAKGKIADANASRLLTNVDDSGIGAHSFTRNIFKVVG